MAQATCPPRQLGCDAEHWRTGAENSYSVSVKARARGVLLVVAAIAIVAVGVWATATRYAHRADAAFKDPGAPTTERVTLRFFRDPSPVPSFTARDLEGRTVSSADWRGKVTIINFWATWCEPCRVEIPDLVALQAKYRGRLQVIGISYDEGPSEAVKRFATQQGMNYPILMLTPEIEQLFPGVYALPTSFILDREARVVQKHVGLLTPTMTELEARSLAGLPVDASIEEVERGQVVKLENTAEVTNIPGLDLTGLSTAQKAEVLEKLNAEPCTCGCELTLAKCRFDDPTCKTSLAAASNLLKQLTAAQ